MSENKNRKGRFVHCTKAELSNGAHISLGNARKKTHHSVRSVCLATTSVSFISVKSRSMPADWILISGEGDHVLQDCSFRLRAEYLGRVDIESVGVKSKKIEVVTRALEVKWLLGDNVDSRLRSSSMISATKCLRESREQLKPLRNVTVGSSTT